MLYLLKIILKNLQRLKAHHSIDILTDSPSKYQIHTHQTEKVKYNQKTSTVLIIGDSNENCLTETVLLCTPVVLFDGNLECKTITCLVKLIVHAKNPLSLDHNKCRLNLSSV